MSAATDGFSAMMRLLDTWDLRERDGRYYRRYERPGKKTFVDAARREARTRASVSRRVVPRRVPRGVSAHAMRCQRPPGSAATRPSSSSVIECRGDRVGAESRARDQQVEVDRVVPDRRAAARAHPAAARARRLQSAQCGAIAASPQLLEHVLRGLDQLRAFADQLVAALRERRMDRAGDREHVAALLAGEARGDQRARRQRRLDDEHAAREPAISRLRRGKFSLRGGVPGGNSDTSAPRAAIACASSRLRAG